ncbi:MAG: extracellular solute-binding protein [Suipraeoptans sp.]
MMKTKAKKIISFVLAGIMLVLATACGNNNSSTTENQGTDSGDSDTSVLAAGEATAAKDITATITVAGWPSGDDGFKAALEGFNEMYPNIEVEFEFNDTTVHMQSLSTSLAAGSGAPDVAMIEGAYIAQYRDSSALVNLLEEPYNIEQYKEDFIPLKWEQCYSVNGSQFVALPWDVGPCTYFYRTDVFEECGLPTEPEAVAKLMSTWEGVLKVSEAVCIPGERWLVPDAAYFYQLMFCNRDFYNEDLTLKLDREGDIDCLNTIIQIRENGWDMNVDMWSTEAYAGYDSGACVSVATGGWFGGFLKNDIDPDGTGLWGVTELPGGIEHCNWGGSFLAIPEQSKNKEAAWAFIQYMLTTARAQNEMLAAVDYFPAYMPAYDDTAIYEAEDAYFGGQKTKALWATIAEDLEPVFNTMMDVTAEACIFTSVNSGLNAGLSAEEIKEQFAKDIEAATAELKNQQIQVYKDAGMWNE